MTELKRATILPECVIMLFFRRYFIGAFILIVGLIGFFQLGYFLLLISAVVLGGASLYWSISNTVKIKKEGLWYLDGTIIMLDYNSRNSRTPPSFRIRTQDNQEIIVPTARERFRLHRDDDARVYFAGKGCLIRSSKIETRFLAEGRLCYEKV